ncbi:hypothetical protein ACFQY0_02605 [Haloferula chungangensis]|uniref:Uncharacterized protein n=1 Tax=Haloferula chungangensis TaxID=1048331 RepID=A0ABW2L3A3_9BACT
MRFKAQALCLLMSCASAAGYQVYTALPYMPTDAAQNASLWKGVAAKSQGLNLNTSDTQAAKRNSPETWKATVSTYQKARTRGMIAIPRTSWNFGKSTKKGTLEDRLAKQFKQENKLDAEIRWVMLYGSQPGEDRSKDAYGYTRQEIQRARVWLDKLEKGGHSPVRLCWNVRNSSKDEKDKCEDPNVDAVLIEGSPEKWYDNKGKRQEFLKWVTTNPKTRTKPLIFQVPFNRSPGEEDIFHELRRFVWWISSDCMMGSAELLRRNDVIILPITYNAKVPFLPETNEAGNRYQNTLAGAALSLIEQRPFFEGRTGWTLGAQNLKDRKRIAK